MQPHTTILARAKAITAAAASRGRRGGARAAVALAVLSAAGAGAVAAAGPASAQTLTCGSTLTASVTLTANLDCSTDTTTSALYIGADGVTVNLNGFSILGPGTAAGTNGIDDSTGWNGLTVEGGGLSGFGIGVEADGGSGILLTGLVLQSLTIASGSLQQGLGVDASYLSGASIHGLSVLDSFMGVNLNNSQDSNISQNHITSAATGFSDNTGSANTWAYNKVSGATGSGFFAQATTNVVFRKNTVTGPGLGGIYVEFATGSTMTANHLNHVDYGIYDYADSSDTVRGNTGTGDGWGIFANAPTGATFTGNRFSYGNYGIETDYPASETLTRNVTNHNTEAGTYIFTGGGSGSYAATLNANTGNDNRYGLYADFATAGTGNIATGNTVTNCFNVTCTAAAAAGPDHPGARPPHHAPRRPVTPLAPARP